MATVEVVSLLHQLSVHVCVCLTLDVACWWNWARLWYTLLNYDNSARGCYLQTDAISFENQACEIESGKTYVCLSICLCCASLAASHFHKQLWKWPENGVKMAASPTRPGSTLLVAYHRVASCSTPQTFLPRSMACSTILHALLCAPSCFYVSYHGLSYKSIMRQTSM